MPHRSTLWALIAFSMASAPALAWDDFGHMVVAAVAYHDLQASPKVRTKVDSLIKQNPSYSQWVKGVPAAKRGEVAFVMAATWADAIKRDSRYQNDGGSNGEDPVEPVASQNIGYSDLNRHKYWHYKDIGFSQDGTPQDDPKTPNVQTSIELFRSTLKSTKATAKLKSYDLVWLVHLVGDAHQPLHATSRFTQDLPHGDFGGNKVVTSCISACPKELHAVWDDALDQGNRDESPDDATALASTLPKAPQAEADIADVNMWLQESFELASSDVYKTPIGSTGKGPYVLDSTYLDNAQSIAKRRVALAGARLAKLIRDALQ